jgi:hypothetical protein
MSILINYSLSYFPQRGNVLIYSSPWGKAMKGVKNTINGN